MSVKTAGVGHFTIPTAPAAGTSCTSGAANVFTTTYVQLIASTAAALYITGIYVEEAAVTAGTYIVVQLATGGAGSETIVGQYLIAPETGSTVTRSYRPIFPPIPVANATRISCKTADSVGAQAKLITLECIAQSNVVDDGVAQSANVTQWNSSIVSTPASAGIPDVNIKNINNVGTGSVTTINANIGLTQPLNFTGVGATALAKADVVDIAGSAVATGTAQLGVNVVNYGGSAGTFAGGRPEVNATHWRGTALSAPATAGIPDVNTIKLTNTACTARDIGASVLLSAGTGTGQLDFTSGVVKANLVQILGTALTETAGQIAAAFKKLFNVATPTAQADNLPLNTDYTSARAAKLDNLDVVLSTRLATAGYTAPDNADIVSILGYVDTEIAAIKAKTDSLNFTVAGKLDVNTLYINGVLVQGQGLASPSHWHG